MRRAFSRSLRSPLTLVVVLVACTSCTSESGDPHSNNGVPPVGGKEKRIKDVADPALPDHADALTEQQSVSGALVIAVDTFDETRNGRGAGTIFVQDLGSNAPYSGISLFAPSFNPGNLRVSPGDVLDLRGSYTEADKIGTTVTFPPSTVLPQISQPIATFRYETKVPEPLDIDAADLVDYAKARRWIGMLVRIKDVTLQRDAASDDNGRVSVDMSVRDPKAASTCIAPFPKPASLVNDLFPVESMNLKKDAKAKSITGIVSFFCNMKLAPRSAADIQL